MVTDLVAEHLHPALHILCGCGHAEIIVVRFGIGVSSAVPPGRSMKRLFRALLVIVALSLCFVVAQEKPAPKAKPAPKPAQKQASAGMPQMVVPPSPEMKKLISALNGTWKAE